MQEKTEKWKLTKWIRYTLKDIGSYGENFQVLTGFARILRNLSSTAEKLHEFSEVSKYLLLTFPKYETCQSKFL